MHDKQSVYTNRLQSTQNVNSCIVLIMEGKTRNNVGHNANISNLQNY